MTNEIKKLAKDIAADQYGGVFTTHQVISDCGFVDFYFIGNYKGSPVIWNACMTTGKGDYYDMIDEIAWDEAYEKYPSKRRGKLRDEFVPTDDGMYTWVDSEPETTEKRLKYSAKRMMELLDAKQHTMKMWNVEIDESYEYGVGLHVRVDKDTINVDDIYQFISLFERKESDAFEHFKNPEVSFNADELGVELSESEKFVIWKDGNPRDTVAVNIDLEDE